MHAQDRTVKWASSLLADLLPDVIQVAHYYATSGDEGPAKARQALKQSDPCRPFHVLLHRYLVRLQDALLRLEHWPKQNDEVILSALLNVLDYLEDYVIRAPNGSAPSGIHPSIPGFGLAKALKGVPWLKASQKPGCYPNLMSWSAHSCLQVGERLPWLLETTCLATPADKVRRSLPKVVEGCVRELKPYLPVDMTRMEDDYKVVTSAKQQAAWQNVQDLCNGMELVHRQLSSAWSCNCPQPHDNLHFAINPCRPLVDGFVASSVLHNSSGWKQTSMHMKYSKTLSEVASYQELCKDLEASSGERPWYTIIKCDSCIQPMTFDQLWHKTRDVPFPKQRLCLAVILSHLYLHLGGGAWWPYKRTDSIIQFQRGDKLSLVPLSPPLFPFDTGQSARPDFRAECINPGMPNLVQFGKLLLEIVTWKPCSWEGSDFEQRLKSLQDRDTDLANADRVLTAVMACTGYRGDDRLRARAEEQTIRSSERMRMDFVDIVIRNLEYVLLEAYSVDTETVFSTANLTAASRRTPTQISVSSNNMQIERAKISITGDRDSAAVRETKFIEGSSNGVPLAMLNDDTGLEEQVDVRLVNEADQWSKKLLPLKRLLPEDCITATKVAILDTGLHFDPDIGDTYPDRYEAFCFLDDGDAPTPRDSDEDGHGTHMASIVLETGTSCKVYSARVCRTRKEVRDKDSFKEVASRIAKAIHYAVDHWDVDIISMSFGFRKKVKTIADAVKYAYDHHVLVVAAAGNNGSLEQVKYPARDPHALCIHAATGYGNMYNGNPTQKKNASNFALVGVAVEGCAPAGRKPGMIRRSGTSQATAVAVGVAALIIQIMRDHQEEMQRQVNSYIYKDALSQLRQLDGMRKVFEKMSEKRGDYEIVKPWRLLEDVLQLGQDRIPSLLCLKIVGLMDIQNEDD